MSDAVVYVPFVLASRDPTVGVFYTGRFFSGCFATAKHLLFFGGGAISPDEQGRAKNLLAKNRGWTLYYLFRGAAWLVPHLPRWLVIALANVLGPLIWLCVFPARRQATINARHVLGEAYTSTASGRRTLRRVVRGMFRFSLRNYLDSLRTPYLTNQEVIHNVYVAHEEYLQEALKLGKGAIIFSAHLGPFEYMARWFTAHGYSVVIPIERLKDERLLRLVVDLRCGSGINYVPLGGSAPLRTIMQALRNNQVVLITADRAVEGESVVRDFFGAPARLPIGPVNLSLRTGAPLLGAFGWRSSNYRVTGTFVPLTLTLTDEQRKQADVVEGALIERMEEVIRAHPEQWIVFSRVWE